MSFLVHKCESLNYPLPSNDFMNHVRDNRSAFAQAQQQLEKKYPSAYQTIQNMRLLAKEGAADAKDSKRNQEEIKQPSIPGQINTPSNDNPETPQKFMHP